MRAHEAFNRSSFSQLVNSAGGRVFRVAAGTVFLGAGLMYRHRAPGIAAMAWSFFPLSAGLLDICWISLALGGPASGATIRALGRRTRADARPDAREPGPDDRRRGGATTLPPGPSGP
jgi:hypothetical protein